MTIRRGINKLPSVQALEAFVREDMRRGMSVTKPDHDALLAAAIATRRSRPDSDEWFCLVACLIISDAENLHEKAWNERFHARMGALSQAHGLQPGEYWPAGQEPAEVAALSEEFEQVCLGITIETLEEYGELALAEMLRTDPDGFWRRFESGRAANFGELDHPSTPSSSLEEVDPK